MPMQAVQRSEQRTVQANGVDLCVQTFGDAAAPPILLIGGAASSMDWWEDEFCEQLAAANRLVIRYDQRDTGESVSYEPGAPQYTGNDLVADAVGLLDALQIPRAHVVGVSMGGGIGQLIALAHPNRVASLTLISTSPIGARDPESPQLPPMSDELAAVFAEPAAEPDWSNRSEVADYIVEDIRHYAGSNPFEEQHVRALVERVVDRTVNIESSMKNHVSLDDGEPVPHRVGDVAAPTLVLHGTADPLFPIGHGEALAREIPGARLVPLEGVGHELPPRPVWDQVVTAIIEHTEASRDASS